MAGSWWKKFVQRTEDERTVARMQATANATADELAADDAGTGELRRIHVVFHGQVQGVGFRWTCITVARELGLTGWVRNEDDFEHVTAELQGTSEHVGAFFTKLLAAYRVNPIHYTIEEREDVPVVDGEAEFRVRY